MASVAEVIVETLIAAGVRRIYGVVGDSLNGLTDSLRKSGKIEWIGVRHEEVAAFAAAVAERAAATLRRLPMFADPSTTTVMPASDSDRSSFLAWLGDTSAFSTAWASVADVSWPPEAAACASSASVRVRTSGSDWRASVTNDLPVANSEHGRSGHGSAQNASTTTYWADSSVCGLMSRVGRWWAVQPRSNGQREL